MRTNRILLHTGGRCPCCRARDRLKTINQAAHAIEQAADEAISFFTPSLAELMDGNDCCVRLFLSSEDGTKIAIDADLWAESIRRLRDFAATCETAADKIELAASAKGGAA